MTVKISGKDFKQWYCDDTEWPKDAYHEDETIKINGRPRSFELDELQTVSDSAEISLRGGRIYTDCYAGKSVSMEGALRQWLKQKSHEEAFERILVEIPKGTREGFSDHVEAIGGRVLA